MSRVACAPVEASKTEWGELLSDIRDAILSETGARAIYLFGSRARGDHRPDSDVDILVVLWNDATHGDPYLRETKERLRKAMPESPWPIDLKVVTAATFEWRRRFVNFVEEAAGREGVPLRMTTEFDDRFSAADEWFQRARGNVQSARALTDLRGSEPDVCFLVQQSVEKYVKGFLTLHDTPAERTHDLTELLNVMSSRDGSFAEWIDRLGHMSEYATATRYPEGRALSREEARAALATVEAFQAFIEDKIERLRDGS